MAEEKAKEFEEEANENLEEEMENAASEESVDMEDTVEAEEEAPEETKGKKSFFGQKKDKKKEELLEKISELTDKYQRLMAEFDNYRKRTDKEKSQQFDSGFSVAVGKILPVVDNFERGLETIAPEDKETPLAAGMDQIYKQMIKILADAGVEPIEAYGKEFDQNLHNAVMQEENEEMEPNTVCKELQKGYTYKGNVIRHSMVSVTK